MLLFLQSFWSRLAGKYGNKFYWQEKGEAASILSAVSYKLQVLRIRSRALACLSLCSSVRDLKKQERVLTGPRVL
jgi:hypothetical protein